MINVITVHWMSAKWVPAQLEYLERNMNSPYRVFASLNGIDDPDVRRRFHYVDDVEGKHPEKLDSLSKTVIERSEPTDILMFLDGDAFPVQPLQPWLDEALERHGLVAVQRKENCEDLRPHPSFCATTVALWKDLGCDWTVTPWTSSTGVTFEDAGGTLAGVLESNSIEWLPLVRTNTYNPHPLWYAVYGHRIYHHGAGFRNRVSKVDRVTKPTLQKAKSTGEDVSLGKLSVAVRKNPAVLLKARPRHTGSLVRAGRRTVLHQLSRRFTDKADVESDEVFGRLSSDKRFYRSFDSTVP
jgi:hypothetical protein